MKYTLARNLSVVALMNYFEHSQGVELNGNTVELSLSVIAIPGGTLTVALQFGNDLENWSTAATTLPVTAVGESYMKWSSLAGRYARLAYNSTVGVVVVAAEIATSHQ